MMKMGHRWRPPKKLILSTSATILPLLFSAFCKNYNTLH